MVSSYGILKPISSFSLVFSDELKSKVKFLNIKLWELDEGCGGLCLVDTCQIDNRHLRVMTLSGIVSNVASHVL